jgi:uncharacterized protein (TIGR01777 family)
VSTVLISGASGFIGSHLARSLLSDGHRVVRLARASSGKAPVDEAIAWDPTAGTMDSAALARVHPDAVVNLAGAPIDQRWTRERREQIRESRVRATTLLARTLASQSQKPRVLVSGSAIGYYGAHRGDELLDENSAPGRTDFLAEVAREWENATRPAADAGIRVVLSRTGLVLGRDGGALARMMLPFKLGVGGRIGDGSQWMSWIALDDMVRALRFLFESNSLSGPVNLVAPAPVQNAEFADALARVLHRPAVVPAPKFALRIALGTMADNTVLASQRALPKKLTGAFFEFRHPRLEEALRYELTRSVDRVDR